MVFGIILFMRFRKLKKQAKTKMQTPLNTFMYARIPDRIKAFITDMFMIYIPILYIITYVVLDGKDEFQASNWAPFIGVFLYGLIYSVLLYKFGQTPGKKAYQIKVVDFKSGQNIGFFQAWLRFVGFLLSAALLIGIIFPFYRKDKRSLHDLIANTVVIATKN